MDVGEGGVAVPGQPLVLLAGGPSLKDGLAEGVPRGAQGGRHGHLPPDPGEGVRAAQLVPRHRHHLTAPIAHHRHLGGRGGGGRREEG